MGPVLSDADVERRWIRIAATRDVGTADRWRDALEAADLDVEVHIEDPRDALPGTAAMPDLVLGAGFAFGVWVPRGEREAAVHALIDAGWDGRHGLVGGEAPPARTVLRGALLALAAAAAVVLIRISLA